MKLCSTVYLYTISLYSMIGGADVIFSYVDALAERRGSVLQAALESCQQCLHMSHAPLQSLVMRTPRHF